MDDEIIQIAAGQTKSGIFNWYVWPENKCIPPRVSKIIGIEIHGHQMFRNSVQVPHVPIKQALEELFAKFSNMEYYAHNANFDARILVLTCEKAGVDINAKNISFCDTLSVLKEAFPKQVSYKQESLVKNITGKTYDALNAAGDVCSLLDLCERVPSSVISNPKHHFTIAEVAYKIEEVRNKRKYIVGYSNLIRDKVMSHTVHGY